MSDKTVLTDDVIVSCLVEAGCLKERKVQLWFERGPYDITVPTVEATNFARAIERAVLAASEDRRDAERYRWLRQYGYQAIELCYHNDGTLMWTDDLDKAIDVAIVAAGNHKVEG